MKLSILIPCFNEIGTIHTVLKKIIELELPVEKEIIVIDDGSTDGTKDYLTKFGLESQIKVILHSENKGKGAEGMRRSLRSNRRHVN